MVILFLGIPVAKWGPANWGPPKCQAVDPPPQMKWPSDQWKKLWDRITFDSQKKHGSPSKKHGKRTMFCRWSPPKNVIVLLVSSNINELYIYILIYMIQYKWSSNIYIYIYIYIYINAKKKTKKKRKKHTVKIPAKSPTVPPGQEHHSSSIGHLAAVARSSAATRLEGLGTLPFNVWDLMSGNPWEWLYIYTYIHIYIYTYIYICIYIINTGHDLMSIADPWPKSQPQLIVDHSF